MDFMKWLNSLDELLYEVMSWIVFFPKTLWRTIRRPIAMMDYADSQLVLPQEEQYAAALSPPLFLALAVMVAHAASAAMGEPDLILANNHGLAASINDQTSALLLRLVIFAAFPLLMALRLLRRKGQELERNTLRQPFYAQCYPAAAFALGFSLGMSLILLAWAPARIAGQLLAGAAVMQFLIVEMRWFASQLGIGRLKALGAAMIGLVEGFVLLFVVGYLFTR
ncbi:MAG: hypothetical protein ABW039_14700 [Sphingobium sp.]